MRVLAFDTSNYTTSVAVFDGGQGHNVSRLLDVEQGSLGLRQSDAELSDFRLGIFLIARDFRGGGIGRFGLLRRTRRDFCGYAVGRKPGLIGKTARRGRYSEVTFRGIRRLRYDRISRKFYERAHHCHKRKEEGNEYNERGCG